MRCQPTQRMSHPARWENIAKPGGDRELPQALQLELKRVHCYGGPVGGEWLLQSMRAFSPRRAVMFARRVKASQQTEGACRWRRRLAR